MPYRQNKKTGEWWEVDANGNPIRPVQSQRAPQGTVLTVPQSPVEARKEQRQTQNDAISQANEAERLRLAREANARAEEEAKRKYLEASAKRGSDLAEAQAGLRGMDNLAKYVDSLRSQYNANFKGKGIGALSEYAPAWMRPANGVFNDTGQSLLADSAKAKGLTGQQFNTPAEQRMFFEPLIPNASDTDEQIVAKINRLQDMVSTGRQRYADQVTALGGTVEPYKPNVPNAMDQTYFQQDQREAVGFGADMRQTQVPPEMQAEWQGYMAQNFNGQIDPDAYVRFRMGLDQKYNYIPEAGREQLYRDEAQKFNDYYNRGGRTIAPMPGPMEKMSTVEILKNSLANNPVTVTAANAADAATLGIPSLIDRTVGPGNMELLNNANPNSALLGQVAGSIAGTSGLGAAGKAVTSRLAPKLLGGEGGAALTRGILNDAAYSGIYGANQGADPLESTLAGAVGSAAGRGVGKTLGTVVGGVDMSPALARLRSIGVTPTIGQIMRGKANPGVLSKLIAGAEDVAANNGISGSVVNAARTRGLAQADNAAFNTVAGDAGRVEGFGLDAVNQLDNIKGAAYSDAAQGVNIPLDDPRFIKQLGAARDRGLAQDFARNRGDFALSTNQGLAPIFGSGEAMNGRQLQDALRFVQGEQRAWNKASNGGTPDPSARGLASAFKDIEDSLIGAAARNAPEAIPKLKKANRINRGLSVLDNAVPPNGEELFTGAQLMNAIRGNNSKLGSGRGIKAAQNSPLFRLASDMQAVLPNKIPPTGVNAAPALALMGLGSSGLGYATDNSTLGGFGAALLATTPYTRKGSEALAKMLIDRPESIKALGAAINKHKRFGGAATIPFMLETQN